MAFATFPVGATPAKDTQFSSDGPAHSDAGRPTNVEEVYQRCRHLGMRLSRQRRMVLDLCLLYTSDAADE